MTRMGENTVNFANELDRRDLELKSVMVVMVTFVAMSAVLLVQLF
ncbi:MULTISPECIES: hypothetical protein [Corallococcus]|nr:MULTISPECIES: hypothetical protein [Corallococcus]MCY1035111.1 hypothetical protein [Corallococcus sp. BB11-1]